MTNWLSASADEESISAYCDHIIKCLKTPEKYQLSLKLMHDVLSRSIRENYLDKDIPIPPRLKIKINEINKKNTKQVPA
jgi:hypothetical protein